MFILIEIRSKKMGSSRNRSRRKRKIPPSRKRVVNQDGKPSRPTYKDPGPSARKIGKNAEALHNKSEPIANILKEGTIFMDLYILFNVFNVLKCPNSSCDIDSHVDMKNKCGYSNYIVLQCENVLLLLKPYFTRVNTLQPEAEKLVALKI